ncbi:MAG: type II toxin-antitoxin system PemK/MazF family toxin [Acidimicrobiia bacterium]|nr:type II toxin-antitoxin system PemK/MazF family toxin [Acidimicrobiia bacterium]
MQRGDLFLAPFLYADLGESKRRPVCVVSGETFNQGPDLIVAMVTSRRARLIAPGVGDVPLTDWESAGLLAPSTVRTGRLQTIEASLLQGQLGSLGQADLDFIDVALREVLHLG